MNGTIIRIISNLYTVRTEKGVIDCRARGKFRNVGLVPLVGDHVLIDEDDAYILEIKKRRNELKRPLIANVDKAIVIASCKRPDFSPFLLDKMLVNIKMNDIEPIVCFSKYDLLNDEEHEYFDVLIKYFNDIGIKALINTDIIELEKYIANSIVVLTGQTGAGKSSLLNKIDASLNLATDDISEALGRGKHTTRHVELFKVKDFFIADTPGFSAFDVIDDKDNIRFAFDEFDNNGCKFRDCKHLNEKGCAVLEQLENGSIMASRYDSYRKMMSDES